MKHHNPKNYPKTINIKDEVYKIKIVKRIPKEDRATYGLCDNGSKTIWIRSDQSNRGFLRTFIHEVLHAIEAEWNIKLKHETVHSLETAIEAFLNDNF